MAAQLLLTALFWASGLIVLWPRWFAVQTLDVAVSTLAGLVLIGLAAGIALILITAPPGGRP